MGRVVLVLPILGSYTRFCQYPEGLILVLTCFANSGRGCVFFCQLLPIARKACQVSVLPGFDNTQKVCQVFPILRRCARFWGFWCNMVYPQGVQYLEDMPSFVLPGFNNRDMRLSSDCFRVRICHRGPFCNWNCFQLVTLCPSAV